MAQSDRSPQEIVNDIYTHIINPLRDFRKQVSPLNSNQIDGVSDFAQTIDGLLTGSDGELAWQGPASDAMANLIGQYLDKEQALTGTDSNVLQGRLLDAAKLCERYADDIETNFIPNILEKPGAHRSSTSSFLLEPLADGPGDDEPQGGEDPENVTETEIGFQGEQFKSDMKWGPQQEALQDLGQLPSFQATLPPADNPLNQNLPADDPQTSTLGLSPEQEQMAEDLANETGQDLGTVRQTIKDNPGLSEDEYRNLLTDPFEEDVDNAIEKAQGDPNKIHHIFENPTHDHQWNQTGLDRNGNWNLIRQTLLDNQDTINNTPPNRPGEVRTSFGTYTVVVRYIIINGALRIADSWVTVP